MEELIKITSTLTNPPVNNIRVERLSEEQKNCVQHSTKCLSYMIKRMEEIKQYLDDSEDVLKTTIYKNHNRFRNDKAFKGMKMVRRTLERIRDLDLLVSIRKFSGLLPKSTDLSKSIYAPSDVMLQQILCAHLKTFFQASRLLHLCEHSSKYLLARIQLGHFWNWALFAFSIISRLWTLAQSLMVYVHLSYLNLRPLDSVCPKSDIKWLPEALEFPSELIPTKSDLSEKETIKSLLNENDFPVYAKKNVSQESLIIGEEVERPKKEEQVDSRIVIGKKQYLRLQKEMSKVKTTADVQNFVKKETEQRLKSRKDAVTKKLEQKDWKRLKFQVREKIAGKDTVKKIKKFIVNFIVCPLHQGENCEDVKNFKDNKAV